MLPKNYAREGLDKQRLGELIDLVGTIDLGDKESRSKDVLGRVTSISSAYLQMQKANAAASSTPQGASSGSLSK